MRTIFLCCAALFITASLAAQNSRSLIIKFKNGIEYRVDYAAKKIIHPSLATIVSMNHLEKLGSIVNKNLPVNSKLKKMELVRDIHFITLPGNTDINEEINRLLSTGLFEYVEKDAIGTGAGVNIITPNDTHFSNGHQWSLKNNGTFSTTAISDADIDMDEAWEISTGDASTIVCVLDAGFKLDHPELSGRVWHNPGEIPGNDIDDDANGYIDDTQGWDWANNDNDPTDDHGHGTNVGSIIAAKGNNASGMAGINWNCELMVGKVLNASNSGSYSWWESGIYYAVANGAKVINMSVGGSGFSATMKNACDFAMANNVTIAACMHNQNTSAPYYPAAYSSVIAVGSTSDNDYRTVPFPWSATSGSNYGSHIDLVAPGNNIIGAYNLDNTSYTYWAGTSQATPEVAGVISLMLALKPDLTFNQVMNVLYTTSQDQVGNPLEDVAGWDQYYGAGRLNALAALNAVLTIIPVKFGEISARRKGNGNELVWSTYSEDDTRYFMVEYSTDRTNWQTIRQVEAAGNTTSLKYYSINHFIGDNADAFYRIKVVNNNSSYAYSKITRVNKTPGGLSFTIHKIISNKTSLNIYTSANRNTDCTFSLYSLDGKLIFKMNKLIKNGNENFSWAVNLAGGRYQLVTNAGGQKVSTAILVE